MATVLSATNGLLKIASPEAAQAFLGQLADLGPAQHQAQLLTQLRLLSEARVAGAARLEILELVLPTILEAQHARSRECWGQPVPFNKNTREIFERCVSLWRTLADAYESLIADMAEAAPELAEHAEVICYRALRCAGFAMIAHNRGYHEVPGTLWEQMHRLYSFAESAGVTQIPVSEGASGRSTVNLAYLQTLLTQRAKPDSLSLLQMITVDRVLAQWAGLASISEAPVVANRELALAVDLGSSEGARRIKHLTGTNLRYLDLSAIGDKLRQTAVALKTQNPDKLGLGPISRDLCEKLIMVLNGHWLVPGTARSDERKPVSFNVLISGTLAAMHFNISGKPFAPPDAGLSSRERFDMAGFQRVDGPAGEASVRSRTLETWAVVNQSPSGILGICHKPSDSTQITHNQLLGLVAPNGNTYVGQVQRLAVDTQGAVGLGLHLLRTKVRAGAARVANSNATYDRALLMAAGPGEAASIIVVPGTYTPSRVLDMHDGSLHQIRLTALIDSGSNFERVTYTAA